MKSKFISTFIIALLSSSSLVAQLHVEGLFHVQEGAQVHVWNDVQIVSTNGVIENVGTIEVEGNWSIDTDASFDGNPSGSGERIIRFKNDNFNQTGDQRISGPMNNTNAFFNLEIDQTGDNDLIDTDSDLEISNNLNFVNGRLRTDTEGHGTDGDAYLFEVFVSNSATTAITGHTMTPATDRYVEGKLRRTVMDMGTYPFPVGIMPAMLDGAEPFEITLNSPAMTATNVLARFQDGTTTTNLETKLCDVGPAPDYTMPDGIDEDLTPDCVVGQWLLDDSGMANFNYDISFRPGSNLLSTCSNAILFYVAQDGVYRDCPDLDGNASIDLTGVSSFGNFDIPTVSETGITTDIVEVLTNDSRIKLFPNPVSDGVLNLEVSDQVFSDPSVTLLIYNQVGMLLKSNETNLTGNNLINVQTLPEGYYNLVIKNKEQLASIPFAVLKD